MPTECKFIVFAGFPGGVKIDCGEFLKYIDAVWRLADLITPRGVLKIFGSHSRERGAEGRQRGIHNCNVLVARIDKDIQIFSHARLGEVGDRITANDEVSNFSFVEYAQKIALILLHSTRRLSAGRDRRYAGMSLRSALTTDGCASSGMSQRAALLNR